MTLYYNLQYSNCRLQYEFRRKASVPARGGGRDARLGTRSVAAGNRAADPEGTRPIHQPELSLADRERNAAAFDQLHAPAAGTLFQGASGLPGGRPGGISERTDLRYRGA